MVFLCSCCLAQRVRPFTKQPGWSGPVAALGALLGSVLILALLDELVVQYDSHGGIVWLPVVVLILGALAVVAWGFSARRPLTRLRSGVLSLETLVPMTVPFYFHGFFFVMLFVAHIAARVPMLVVISLAMLLTSLTLHGILLWHMLPEAFFPSFQKAKR